MEKQEVIITPSEKSALVTFERRVLSARQSAEQCHFTKEFNELTILLHKIEAAYIDKVKEV